MHPPISNIEVPATTPQGKKFDVGKSELQTSHNGIQ